MLTSEEYSFTKEFQASEIGTSRRLLKEFISSKTSKLTRREKKTLNKIESLLKQVSHHERKRLKKEYFQQESDLKESLSFEGEDF